MRVRAIVKLLGYADRVVVRMETKNGIDGNDVSNRCRAFTLVELLVVVSIISLLASILLPSLGRAKDIAKQVVCMSNQRVVGIAIRYYAQDNEEYLPAVVHFVDDVLPYLDRTSLPSDVKDYTRKTLPQALFCPCDPDPFPRPFMDFLAKIEMTSWCLNGADTVTGMGGGAKIRLGLFGGKGRITDPDIASDCMMFTETTSFDRIGDLDHPAAIEVFDKAGASGQIPLARARWHHRVTTGFFHDGKANVHFMDGHSKPIKGKKVPLLPISQWPYAYSLDNTTTFYPDLSLPSASEAPKFWGPPYQQWNQTP